MDPGNTLGSFELSRIAAIILIILLLILRLCCHLHDCIGVFLLCSIILFFPLGVPYHLVPAMCLQPPSWLDISYTRPYFILCPHQLQATLCGALLFPMLLRNGSQGDLMTQLSSKNSHLNRMQLDLHGRRSFQDQS